MNLVATLDLAIEIERKFSECYAKMSEIFQEPHVSEVFDKLSRDELIHLNLINAGKNYVFKAPEAFPQECDFYYDMEQGLKLINYLYADLNDTSISLKEALERMYNLESKFEQVHMNSIVDIKDAHLKELFEALAEGDKVHAAELKIMVEALGVDR